MTDYTVTLNDLDDAGRIFEIVEDLGDRADIRGRVVTFDQRAYDQLRSQYDADGDVGISEDFGRFLWLDGNEYNVQVAR